MELNREQIVKALECCTNKTKDGMYEIKCIECPFEIGNEDCKDLDAQALSLIKELTEENERLRVDTVREMQERLMKAFKHRSLVGIGCIAVTIDQIAKEMTEGV